ncbi:MAG: PD-(D/E)XK nuclease family transposase [Fusobacteriaceae bacterium]
MGNSKVNPRVDFIFKKIFGVDENKDLLMDLINYIAGETYELPPELKEVTTIKKAMSILENIQMSSSEREAYEARLKWLRDEVGAINTAKKEGIEIGVLKEKMEIAMSMLEDGMSVEKISKLTGLLQEKIEKLKNS